MLILSRRTGERFVVRTPAGDIWVTVFETDRGKTKLGIDAPQEYQIWREELLGRVGREPPAE